MLSYKLINSKTRTLLKEFGLYSAPVDVFELIEEMGIDLHFDELPPDLSGLISIEPNKAQIIINKQHHINRKRFTAAHEVGHYILHREVKSLFLDESFSKGMTISRSEGASAKLTFNRDKVSEKGEHQLEVEANRFAASLLMPDELVNEAIVKMDVDISDEYDVLRLAKKFGTSEQAMALRISRLGATYF